MRKSCFISLILLVGVFMFSYVSAAIPISTCGDLSSSTDYYLTKNINSSGVCLTISAVNVIIDGKGFSIEGNINGLTGGNLTLKNIFVMGNITSVSNGLDIISVVNSTVNSVIYDGVRGSGGRVILINSNVNLVSAPGGYSYPGSTFGGSVTVENSSFNSIYVDGNSAAYTYAGVGGIVDFICSSESSIVGSVSCANGVSQWGPSTNPPGLSGDCDKTCSTCASFQYSDWSSCINNQQTRTVLNLPRLGCPNGNTSILTQNTPILTQSCISPTCSFKYTGYGECVGGLKRRDIVETYPFGCAGGTPKLESECSQSLEGCNLTSHFVDEVTGECVCDFGRGFVSHLNSFNCINKSSLAQYAPVVIYSCGEINSGDNYLLDRNLNVLDDPYFQDNGVCFVIAMDNVDFRLGGSNIFGGNTNGNAIVVSGKNVSISNFGGFYPSSSYSTCPSSLNISTCESRNACYWSDLNSTCYIRENLISTIEGFRGSGIYAYYTPSLKIKDIFFNNSYVGIYFGKNNTGSQPMNISNINGLENNYGLVANLPKGVLPEISLSNFSISLVNVSSVNESEVINSPEISTIVPPMSDLDGDGYIEIHSCEQLQKVDLDFTNNLNYNYKLANDIDCSGSRNWNNGSGFKPIGRNGIIFSGSFNGNKKKIKGLYINRPNEDFVGLFSVLEGNNKVYDLELVDVAIAGHYVTGGLVGGIGGNSIYNVYVSGNILCSSYSGGLTGYQEYSIINNSYFVGNIFSPTGGFAVGGLVGQQWKGAKVINSYAIVTLIAPYDWTGGLVGQQHDFCYPNSTINSFSISNKELVGRVVWPSNTIINSYWFSSNPGIDYCYLGGMYTPSPGNLGCMKADSAEYFKNQTNQPMAGWDFTNTWAINKSINQGYPYLKWQNFSISKVVVPPKEVSKVIDYNYIPISTCEQLQNIGNNLSANYELVNNINCYDTKNWNNGAGFIPIGGALWNSQMDAGFAGTFEGNNYKISGLYINKVNGPFQIGLFNRNKGVIRNLIISDFNITFSYRGGVIVGENAGNITHCTATSGTIRAYFYPFEGYSNSNYTYVGRPANYIGDLGGLTNYVGGLVGLQWSPGVISRSSSIDISVISIGRWGTYYSAYNGGIVGINGGKFTLDSLTGGLVSDSFSNANIFFDGWGGGLAGSNGGSGVVKNSYSYSTGVGLIAYSPGAVLSSYWDNQTGIAGIGKTTDQMKLHSTYKGWDFKNIWAIDADKNNGYPYLKELTTEEVQSDEDLLEGLYVNNAILIVDKATVVFPEKVYISNTSKLKVYDSSSFGGINDTLEFSFAGKKYISLEENGSKLLGAINIAYNNVSKFLSFNANTFEYPALNVPYTVSSYSIGFSWPTANSQLLRSLGSSRFFKLYSPMNPFRFQVKGFELCLSSPDCTKYGKNVCDTSANLCEVNL